MSEQRPVRQHGEKDEKQEEKDEKGRQEKSWDEKWRRDPLSSAVWALILIWAGVVLLVANLDLAGVSWLNAWPLFFLGAGAILFVEVLVRVLVPAYRAPLRGPVVLAIIFLAIGVGGLFPAVPVWALILIGLGVYLLLSGLLRPRQ